MFEGVQIGINDLMQILVLYLGIYTLLRFVKGTRSAQVLLGFCVLVVSLLLFTYMFRFDVLARVVYFLLIYLALSMVVVFQQEIRRVLALVGGQRLFGRQQYTVWQETVPEKLCKSLMSLGKSRIGALIAIERGISLHGFEETGVKLNALLSHELLVSIFTPPLPMHDGGVIIRDGMIAAAHCLFPVSNRTDLPNSGMRHRAAVGLSEETDAVVIVVSEETGKISVTHNGRLHRYSDAKVEKLLLRWLRKAMPNETRKPTSLTDWIVSYMKKLVNGR
jgi:diadenylate cyclase